MNKHARRMIDSLARMERKEAENGDLQEEEEILKLIGLIHKSDVPAYFLINGQYDENGVNEFLAPCSENQQLGFSTLDPETGQMYGASSLPWSSVNKLLHITKKTAVEKVGTLFQVPQF